MDQNIVQVTATLDGSEWALQCRDREGKVWRQQFIVLAVVTDSANGRPYAATTFGSPGLGGRVGRLIATLQSLRAWLFMTDENGLVEFTTGLGPGDSIKITSVAFQTFVSDATQG